MRTEGVKNESGDTGLCCEHEVRAPELSSSMFLLKSSYAKGLSAL